jgi:hypothetical protein
VSLTTTNLSHIPSGGDQQEQQFVQVRLKYSVSSKWQRVARSGTDWTEFRMSFLTGNRTTLPPALWYKEATDAEPLQPCLEAFLVWTLKDHRGTT